MHLNLLQQDLLRSADSASLACMLAHANVLATTMMVPRTSMTDAAAPQADIAVLDEIDSGLDIDALRDVADAVNSLKRPNSATLMVTHYKVLITKPQPVTFYPGFQHVVRHPSYLDPIYCWCLSETCR